MRLGPERAKELCVCVRACVCCVCVYIVKFMQEIIGGYDIIEWVNLNQLEAKSL